MICKGCQFSFNDEYNFCPKCGLAKEGTYQKIEYRDEIIPLNFKWKGHYAAKIIDSMPLKFKEEANQLIYKKIQESGESGWEPVENKTDIISLIRFISSSKLFYTTKRKGLITNEVKVSGILVRFKRTIRANS